MIFTQKHTKKRSTCARFTYVYRYRLPPHIKCGFSGVRRKNRAILLLSIVKEQYSLSPFVGYEGLSSAVSNKSCVSGCWRKRSSPLVLLLPHLERLGEAAGRPVLVVLHGSHRRRDGAPRCHRRSTSRQIRPMSDISRWWW